VARRNGENLVDALSLTEIGESAPRLLSRKNEAESMEATVNKMGLDCCKEEVLIGGRDDQTLPSIRNIHKINNEYNSKIIILSAKMRSEGC